MKSEREGDLRTRSSGSDDPGVVVAVLVDPLSRQEKVSRGQDDAESHAGPMVRRMRCPTVQDGAKTDGGGHAPPAVTRRRHLYGRDAAL